MSCMVPVPFRWQFAIPFLLTSSSPQPKQCIKDEFVLDLIIELKGQLFIGFIFVIDIVMAHIGVDHPVFFICPSHRIVATVPYFVLLGTCAEGKTGGIDR